MSYAAKRGRSWSGAQKRARKRTARGAMLGSLVHDQAFVYSYVDNQTFTGTTNSICQQLMWYGNAFTSSASGASVSSAGATVAHLGNLQVLDPVIAQACVNYSLDTVGTSGAAITSRALIKDYQVKCSITNAETAPCELLEYRLIAKHDISYNSLVGIFGAFNDPTGNLYQTAIQNMISPATASAVVTVSSCVSYGTLGITPFMNPWIKQFFKIAKPRYMWLKPGMTKKIVYRLKRPQVFANEYYNGSGPSGLGAGVTNAGSGPVGPTTIIQLRRGHGISLFVAKGTYATNTGARAAYTVGLSNINLGLVYEIKMHYSLLAPNSDSVTVIANIPGFSVNSAAVPAPVVINQPASVIAVNTRSYPSNTNTGVQDGSETIS
jgi:hypothetical protein